MFFRLFRLVVVGVLLVLVFVYGPRWWQAHVLEQKLARLTEQLAADGLDGIEAVALGERLHLGGKVKIAMQRDRAVSVASRYFAPDTIDTEIAVAPPVSPYLFSAQLEDGQLSLQGYVPGEPEHEALRSWMMDHGFQMAMDRLRLAEGAPVDWGQTVRTALEALQAIGAGDVDIAWRVVLLRGSEIAPQAAIEARKLLAPLADAGYETVLQSIPVLSCSDRLQALVTARPLHFDAGRAEISVDSQRFIDELAELARSCPKTSFSVHGFTDNRGDPEANRVLSQQRAEAVVQAVVDRGVAPDQLTAIGHGAASPIADNSTEAGRARNRRIEFTVNASTISDKQK